MMAVCDVLGTIELDPASSALANETVKAHRFFTTDQDGLLRDWTAQTVWLNPPYSQPLISQFVDKLLSELSNGNCSEAIVLTHNYTDTGWFHAAHGASSAICFTRGRIGFVSPSGERASATQGQAFFYFGERVERFAERFKSIGFVVVPYEI